MDKFHPLKVTHTELERVLLDLGSSVSLHETHRLYENKAHRSLLLLPPDIPMEQQVRPTHLSSVRHAVVAFGVADEATLTTLLLGPGVSVFDSSSANGHAPDRSRSSQRPAPAGSPVEAG